MHFFCDSVPGFLNPILKALFHICRIFRCEEDVRNISFCKSLVGVRMVPRVEVEAAVKRNPPCVR
jgi:hypothetical protein